MAPAGSRPENCVDRDLTNICAFLSRPSERKTVVLPEPANRLACVNCWSILAQLRRLRFSLRTEKRFDGVELIAALAGSRRDLTRLCFARGHLAN